MFGRIGVCCCVWLWFGCCGDCIVSANWFVRGWWCALTVISFDSLCRSAMCVIVWVPVMIRSAVFCARWRRSQCVFFRVGVYVGAAYVRMDLPMALYVTCRVSLSHPQVVPVSDFRMLFRC